MFDPAACTTALIDWIGEHFASLEDPNARALIWINGGSDSTIAAKCLCEALGPDRVWGFAVDTGKPEYMGDIERVFDLLHIYPAKINFYALYHYLQLSKAAPFRADQFKLYFQKEIDPNLISFILFNHAKDTDDLVCSFKNLSDIYLGWCAPYIYSQGDCFTICNLTKTEVLAIGNYLELPVDIVNKCPRDPYFANKTDEDKFGFTYAVLDEYIRTGVCSDLEIKTRIDSLHYLVADDIITLPQFDPSDFIVP